MSIACITPVRDNEDIIELFIRINSKVIDHFYIIDNLSKDRTSDILLKLQREGYRITIFQDINEIFDYAQMVCNVLWTQYSNHDWFFFLDSDEFLSYTKEDILLLLSKVPNQFMPKMFVRTWVPLEDNYDNYMNPLWSMFKPLQTENVKMAKVIARGSQGEHCNIMFGAHEAFMRNTRQKISSYDSGIRYDHFPVRSSKQIKAKILLGKQKLDNGLYKHQRTKSIFHIDVIADIIKQNNGQVSVDLMKQLAISYCADMDVNGNYSRASALSDIKFGESTDVRRYR